MKRRHFPMLGKATRRPVAPLHAISLEPGRETERRCMPGRAAPTAADQSSIHISIFNARLCT